MGYTDDQQRDPAHRPRPPRRPAPPRRGCARTPRPARHDDGPVEKSSSELGLARHRRRRGTAARAWGRSSWRSWARSSGGTVRSRPPSSLRPWRPPSSPPPARTSSARAGFPGLASGELVGAVGTAQDGQYAGWCRAAPTPAWSSFVEGDGMRRCLDARRGRGRAAAGDRPDPPGRPHHREPPGPARPCPATPTRGMSAPLVGLVGRARGRVQPRAGHDRGLRQGAQAVRHAGGRLPGRLAPLRADAAGDRDRPRDHGRGGVDGGRRAPAPGPVRGAGQGDGVRRRPRP